MGVINLGALVEKLKKKLAGSGFVTKTDYATASTGGVVKVGTTGGLQVSSGTLKGKTLADATAYAAAGDDVVMTKGDMEYVGGGGGGAVQVYSGDPVTIETNKEITLSEDVSTKAFLIVQIRTLENRFATAVVSFAGTTIGSESQSQVNAGYMAANAQSTLVLYCRLSANNKLKLTYATGTPGSIIAIFAI